MPMTLTSRRKLLWLAVAAFAICLLLVRLLSPGTQQPQPPDLRILGQPQMTNGVMLISIVLSNGTSSRLNIVDDRIGNPFMVLDAGRSNLPGTIGWGLGNLANSLKLNLPRGAVLTNTVRLTNPPPRFRLLVETRDLAWERRGVPMELLRFLAAKATRNPPKSPDYILLARSPLIVTAHVSNTTWNTTTLGRTNSASP